jgi:NAD(P)H-dependent FMN reductase
MMTISVIVGSTRQGRFSEKPAQWILGLLQKRKGIEGQFSVSETSQCLSSISPRRRLCRL